MRVLDFHGKKIYINESLAVEYEDIRGEINIDDMDLSVVNMLYHRLPQEQTDEWKKQGVLRKKLIEYAMRSMSDEEITEGIVAGIKADIDIGRALMRST